MTLRITQVKTDRDDENSIKSALIKKLKLKSGDLKSWKVYRKSVDARKGDVHYSWTVDVDLKDEKKHLGKRDIQAAPDKLPIFVPTGTMELSDRPVVAGFGPAGMFAALELARCGYRPLVIERGAPIDQRQKDVENFWKTGQLDPESNVQYGEGGAGAFSDGKLTTRSKDKMVDVVLELLHKHGAQKDILIDAYPHIGTDAFVRIIESIRREIISLGGEFRFHSKLEGIKIKDGQLSAIQVNDEWIDCEALILALGHSATDTIRTLYTQGLPVSNKPFQVGVRIEHTQDFINEAMLHDHKDDERLTPARYTLTAMSDNGKGIYTFCMCPGGYVISSAFKPGHLVVNGMSYSDRGGKNANSALLVQVNEKDYGDRLFAGVDYQEELERRAFKLGGSFRAPVQKAHDYLEGRVSESLSVEPTYEPGTTLADLNELFSDEVNHALKQGLEDFERKVPGFLEGTLTGVESRASSAIRIDRDKETRMSIEGIYPAGEGSGYAGGIMTSAIDGMKSAQALMDRYAKPEH